MFACLTSQQHTSVSQGRICSDNCTCCHIEIELAGQTFHLTQSQYTDTWPTSPSVDPCTPGAWQGSHWGAKFLNPGASGDSNPGSSALEVDALTTRPMRWYITNWKKNPHEASQESNPGLPLSRRTPHHKANEAVGQTDTDFQTTRKNTSVICIAIRRRKPLHRKWEPLQFKIDVFPSVSFFYQTSISFVFSPSSSSSFPPTPSKKCLRFLILPRIFSSFN